VEITSSKVSVLREVQKEGIWHPRSNKEVRVIMTLLYQGLVLEMVPGGYRLSFRGAGVLSKITWYRFMWLDIREVFEFIWYFFFYLYQDTVDWLRRR
jgi:hypothetical protein